MINTRDVTDNITATAEKERGNLNIILKSARGRLVHISQRLAGNCIARTAKAEPLTPLSEVSSLVCVNEGVYNTVEDPKEHQPTGQVEGKIRSNPETIAMKRKKSSVIINEKRLCQKFLSCKKILGNLTFTSTKLARRSKNRRI